MEEKYTSVSVSELDDVVDNQRNCPKCGAPLIVRNTKNGHILGCSNYPVCNYLENINIHGVKILKTIKGKVCPICGGELAVKKSKYGLFIGCLNKSGNFLELFKARFDFLAISFKSGIMDLNAISCLSTALAFKKQYNNLLAVDLPVEFFPPTTFILAKSILAESIGPKLFTVRIKLSLIVLPHIIIISLN